MEDRTVRASMKTVWAAYALAFITIAACVWAYFRFMDYQPRWFLAFPLLLLIPPLRMQMKRRLVTLRLHDDHLTLESGLLSRTRRTLDVVKIQDVTVRQTIWQRIIGVGDLMLESAGESGRMSILNVDRPRDIADNIIAASKRTTNSL